MSKEEITEILQMFTEWSNEDLNYNDIQNFLGSDRFKDYQMQVKKQHSKLSELEQENERLRDGLDNIVYKSLDDGNYYNRFMENYPLNICEFTDIDELLTNKTNK